VWREEASLIPAAYDRFADRLPKALWQELDALMERLEADDAPTPARHLQGELN
jgi:hypothetical protein